MATQVAVKFTSTGAYTFYSTYAAARIAASSGDVIQIWADLDEQIILKNGVDIWIAPERIVDMTSGMATIIDNGVSCECNIFGDGIIKNSFTSEIISARYECVKITNGSSKVNIYCDYLESIGKGGSATGGQTVNIVVADEFSLNCNSILCQKNSVITVNACSKLFIKCKKILSGYGDTNNEGATVITSNLGLGFINADELICKGPGSCLIHLGGTLNVKILKTSTLDSENASEPTVLLEGGTGEQELIYYFDEINNFNTTLGHTAKLSEGNSTFKGRRIYSNTALCLDLAANAYIKCIDVVSGSQAINISNSETESIFIDAEYIEGNNNIKGVIYSSGSVAYTIKNAKINNLDPTSGSTGIYIDPDSGTPVIQLINLIIISGSEQFGGTSIFCNGEVNVYNYGLFVKRETSGVDFLVGTISNYKFIEDPLVS